MNFNKGVYNWFVGSRNIYTNEPTISQGDIVVIGYYGYVQTSANYDNNLIYEFALFKDTNLGYHAEISKAERTWSFSVRSHRNSVWSPSNIIRSNIILRY